MTFNVKKSLLQIKTFWYKRIDQFNFSGHFSVRFVQNLYRQFPIWKEIWDTLSFPFIFASESLTLIMLHPSTEKTTTASSLYPALSQENSCRWHRPPGGNAKSWKSIAGFTGSCRLRYVSAWPVAYELLALRDLCEKSSAQLSPWRSHFYIDNELLDSEEDRIAMIYVTAVQIDSIKESWVGANSRKRQYAFVLNLEWSDGSVKCRVAELPRLLWISVQAFGFFSRRGRLSEKIC